MPVVPRSLTHANVSLRLRFHERAKLEASIGSDKSGTLTDNVNRRGGCLGAAELALIFRRAGRNLYRAPAYAVFEIENIQKIIRFIARQVRQQRAVKNDRLPGEDIDHRPDIVGFDLETVP